MNSIFCQVSSESIEVIIVNDGTPDQSMTIVNEFSAIHPQIVVFQQENQGLSCARNAGLELASGDYVWFVDSDDQLEDDSIDYLLSYLYDCESDIIGFDLTAVWEYCTQKKRLPAVLSAKDKILYGKDLRRRDTIHHIQTAPAQRFIFKRDFLKKYNLFFYPGIIHEDVEFMGRALFFAKNIRIENKALYRYLQRETGSIMATLDFKSMKCRDIILHSLMEFRRKYAISSADIVYVDDYMLKVLQLMLSFKHSDKNTIISFIKENQSFYRKIALNGLLANFDLNCFKKVIRGMFICLSPSLYYRLVAKRK